mgnify:FL=1
MMTKSIKRMLALLCAVTCLTAAFCGCSDSKYQEETGGQTSVTTPDLPTLPTLTLEEPFIVSNAHQKFYQNFTMAKLYDFMLYSPYEIDMEHFSGTIEGLQTPYRFSISPRKLDELPNYVYASYRGIDWQHLFELEKATSEADFLSEEHMERLAAESAYREQFFTGYDQFAESLPVSLYAYYILLSVQMPEQSDGMPQEESIRQVQLTLNGENKTFDLGEIKLFYDFESFPQRSNAFDFLGPATEAKIDPEADGIVADCISTDFKTNAAVTIRNLSFFDDSQTAIESAAFSFRKGDLKINQLWTPGETIQIPANSEGSLTFTFKDPSLAGQLIYEKNYYFVVDYDVDGESGNPQSSVLELQCLTRLSPYEVLFERCCGTDPLDYYYHYYHAHMALNLGQQ